MLVNLALHIWHAAVGQLQGVFVEYLPKLVPRRKAFFDHSSEFSANVRFHPHVKRRIKPGVSSPLRKPQACVTGWKLQSFLCVSTRPNFLEISWAIMEALCEIMWLNFHLVCTNEKLVITIRQCCFFLWYRYQINCFIALYPFRSVQKLRILRISWNDKIFKNFICCHPPMVILMKQDIARSDTAYWM